MLAQMHPPARACRPCCESCGGHCSVSSVPSVSSSSLTSPAAGVGEPAVLCADCRRLERAANDMYCDEAMDDPCQRDKPKKTVRWDSITIHEFGVGLGGSAVSNKGGPSIGLADAPEFTWTTRVGEMAERSEGVHRFSAEERVRLLQAAGVSDGMIERHAKEASIILGSRRRTFLEDLAEERKEKSRKRTAEQAVLERPCAVPLRRPRMIPANYV